jgi:hypothetical protein
MKTPTMTEQAALGPYTNLLKVAERDLGDKWQIDIPE